MGGSHGAPFIFLTLGVLGAYLGPTWVAVGLAGYTLGAKRGAIAAALGCVTAGIVGFALGSKAFALSAAAATKPLVDVGKMPKDLFDPAWVARAWSSLGEKSVERFFASFTGMTGWAVLAVQIAAWALGAAVTAMIAAKLWHGGKERLAPLSAIVGIAIPAAAAFVLRSLGGPAADPATVATTFGLSAAAAVGAGYAWDLLFPVETPAPAPAVTPAAAAMSTMAAEDEDVDELLRLIATAEEKVATQYTSVKTVLITDMKSFSHMTEEYGSALTAKAVQRHRDLLLPAIQRHGGQGKSTGGDGIIAAFDDASTAVAAAIEMQQVLAEHNSNHPYEHDMTVRIGIAYGEVVLDRGGRPFIGNALNVAARIMNLADGGQTFTTATVMGRAGLQVATHSHGQFELKNIDKPVEVIEVLWHEGQQPVDPRTRTTG